MMRKSNSTKKPTKHRRKSQSKIDQLSPKKIEKYLENFLKKFRKESTDQKQKAIMQNYLHKRETKKNSLKMKKSEKYIHANFSKDIPHFLNPEFRRKHRKRGRFNSNWSEFASGLDKLTEGRVNKSLGVSGLKRKKGCKESALCTSWFKHLRQISKGKKKKKDTRKLLSLLGKEEWENQIPLINQSNQEYMHRRTLVDQTLLTSGLMGSDLRQSQRGEYKLPKKVLQGETKTRGLHPKIQKMKVKMMKEIQGEGGDSNRSVSFSDSAGRVQIMKIYEDSLKELLEEGSLERKKLMNCLWKERRAEGQVRNLKTSMKMYRVIKLLGKGSFGRVFLALQKLTNRLVAIKSLAKSVFNDGGLKAKIQGEVQMMKTLTGHPFIISLLEVFENSKYVFFVTEYAAKRDLLRALKKNSKIIPGSIS